ncbi:MAG: aspartate racemase [Caulobacter sp.]|nr:aspartate racemase [Caulobacter sp.]
MKVLGVLGGMGPAATLDFLAKLQAATPAARDQDHIRVLMDLNPQVPDRNVEGGAAGPVLAQMAVRLREAGAQVLAMPCNTAHLHAEEIRAASGLPLIDLIDVAVDEMVRLGGKAAGVLATDLAGDMYAQRIRARGLESRRLSPTKQHDMMTGVYRVKAGTADQEDREAMRIHARYLIDGGSDVIIAGCTEIPLLLGSEDIPRPFIDPAEVLARACVAACR